MRRSVFFTTLSLMITLLFAAACSQGTEEEVKERIRPVVTYTVPEILQSREWSTSGTAKNALETPLSFRIGGTVTELPAKVGMEVKTGDTIAVLDPTDTSLELRAAEAELNVLNAELTNAKTNYKRIRVLVQREAVSQSELDQATAEYDAIKARVAKQKDQVELARRTLSYTRLIAPQDGAINSVPIELHSNVSPGEPVVTMSSGSILEISLGVPDKLVPYVRIGDKVKVRFDVFRSISLKGTVTEVGIATDGSSTYPVTVVLDEEDDRLRSGMVGEVSFDFRQVKKLRMVSVPSVAVFGESGDKKYVWVVSSEGTVGKREVEVGLPDDVGLVILKGLQPGERVVVRGVHSLLDGQKVLIKD